MKNSVSPLYLNTTQSSYIISAVPNTTDTQNSLN